MTFLHGVETIEVESGARPINATKANVVGLVGIAPKGATNALTVITNERQATETFGAQLPGFTIPQALAALFAQGGVRVVVVNTFDNSTMVTAVTDESQVVSSAGKAKTTNAPIPGLAFSITNQAKDTTYVNGVDYSVDDFGNITVLNFSSIAAGATVLVNYSHLDATAITDAVIIGTDSGGTRTGHKLFADAYQQFGYLPKLLICPSYCENTAVAAEMIVQAEALRAHCFIDAPTGTTVANAIAGRGAGGTLAGFKTSSKAAVLCYPNVKAYDPATEAQVNRALSPFAAGVYAANPNYWESGSNREIKGITGVELSLTASISDSNSEVNQLNEVGITTVFSGFGTGFRLWGNRSAAFPTITTIDNFASVQRVKNVLHDSVEAAMIQFIDKPINQGLIDSIRESVNAFIRTLMQRGAITDGECFFNAADNTAVQIAAGQLTFEIEFAAPTPAERITFKSFLDINRLTSNLAA